MPYGKAYEGGGHFFPALLEPRLEIVSQRPTRRRTHCALWLMLRLDDGRSRKASYLTPLQRMRLACSFHDALSDFIAQERGAINVTPSELARNVGGDQLIQAAQRAYAEHLRNSDLNSKLADWLTEPVERGPEAVGRHQLLTRLIRSRLIQAGWRERLTIDQLAERLRWDPAAPDDAKLRDTVHRISELKPGSRGYLRSKHGGSAFQILVASTAPTWVRWTGRSARIPRERLGGKEWETGQQYGGTLYGLLKEAVSQLQRQPNPLIWSERPKSFNAIVSRSAGSAK